MLSCMNECTKAWPVKSRLAVGAPAHSDTLLDRVSQGDALVFLGVVEQIQDLLGHARAQREGDLAALGLLVRRGLDL